MMLRKENIVENKLEKLLEYVTKEENRYYELSNKSVDENNILGMQIMSAQATAFQRVRYTIQNLIEEI